MVTVPRGSLEAVLAYLAEEEDHYLGEEPGSNARKHHIWNHVRKLNSAIGVAPKVASRTLHSIVLHDEEKIGRFYVGRDSEGMLRVYDTKQCYGYIGRWYTEKRPICFKVRLFLSPRIKVNTFEFLDQAEAFLRRQVAKGQQRGRIG
jgi:hypothetical protein